MKTYEIPALVVGVPPFPSGAPVKSTSDRPLSFRLYIYMSLIVISPYEPRPTRTSASADRFSLSSPASDFFGEGQR